jgi:methylenetetrahydrofolate reductase (NADPH)
LPQIFRIDLPEDLIQAVEGCKTNADKNGRYRMGYSTIIRAQSSRSSTLLFYGKSENIKQIARMVF